MRDVLEDDPTPTPNACTNCDRGWVTVKHAYAHAEALKAGAEDSADYRQRYASAIATIYPCRVCRPGAFMRWAGHHFEPDHDRSECVECSSPRKRTGQKSRSYDPPPPGDRDERPERKDLA